jgi:hypothetical protein
MAANPVTSGLRLSLDSRSIAGLSDSDPIPSWTDSLGQTCSQATAARQPTYRTNVIGQNPVVRFAGGDDSLHGTLSGWSSGTGYTLAVLASNRIVASSAGFGGLLSLSLATGDDFNNVDSCVLHIGNGGGRATWHFVHDNVALVNSSAEITTAGAAAGSCLPIPNYPGVIISGVSASEYYIGVNGSQLFGAYSRSAGNPTRFTIGNRFLSGAVSTIYGVAFDIALACAYSRFLTISEQFALTQWMLSEFGIVSDTGGTAGFTGIEGISRSLGT